ARYQLLKWPQTEREFPRHFRIATVMMRGAARLEEVAATAGVRLEEVIDFVNANLATGFARPEQPEAAAPAAPRQGLFGRLRARRVSLPPPGGGGTRAYLPSGSVLVIDPQRSPRLSRIQVPADLRAFPAGELPAIADELRAYLIEQVAQSGGHFGAGLGVIE